MVRIRPIESARRAGMTLSTLKRNRRSGGFYGQPSISRKPFREFVYQRLSADGSPMYVKASGKPVFDANGEFCGYRGTGTDATAITRAQEALRESERSARSALDGIAGLVSILAPVGEVEAVNRQVLDYFGRSLES